MVTAVVASRTVSPFTIKLDSNGPGQAEPSFAFDGIVLMLLHRNGLARD
jgi:hypothetical protein